MNEVTFNNEIGYFLCLSSYAKHISIYNTLENFCEKTTFNSITYTINLKTYIILDDDVFNIIGNKNIYGVLFDENNNIINESIVKINIKFKKASDIKISRILRAMIGKSECYVFVTKSERCKLKLSL